MRLIEEVCLRYDGGPRFEAPIARAFEVFTGDFGSFKPAEHNMLAVRIAETVFEPRVGGYLYDRGTDGSECWPLYLQRYADLVARQA